MAKKASKKKTASKKAASKKTTTTTKKKSGSSRGGQSSQGKGSTQQTQQAPQQLKVGKKKTDGTYAVLPINQIKVVKGHNPRQTFEGIEDLAKSIKREGLLQALIVRPYDSKNYALVAGERRLRALQELGQETVDVKIRDDITDEGVARAIAASENSGEMRRELTHIEIGKLAIDLRDNYGWKISQIATKTDIHSRKVRRCVDLLDNAPKDVRQAVEKGEMPFTVGLSLAEINDSKERKAVQEELERLGETEPSSATVKKVRKSVAKQAESEGSSSSKSSSSSSRSSSQGDAALVTWKNKREMQATLNFLAYAVVNAEEDEKDTAVYEQTRGAVAALLWCRNEIEYPEPPSDEPQEGESKADHEKRQKHFDKLLDDAASRYEPEDEEEPEEEGEEGYEEESEDEEQADEAAANGDELEEEEYEEEYEEEDDEEEYE